MFLHELKSLRRRETFELLTLKEQMCLFATGALLDVFRRNMGSGETWLRDFRFGLRIASLGELKRV